mmetsp:Transcript_3668/g.8735  ORF Transcript_3668/g.8735 Transcript_3668/m.8735 type:complete len:554 (+) Transcript_3668:3-1664(+)
MAGDGKRGRSFVVSMTLLRRPLRLFCLLLISRLCSFSIWNHFRNENGFAPSNDSGAPFMVASWTMGTSFSGRTGRYSTSTTNDREFKTTFFAVSSSSGEAGTNSSSTTTPSSSPLHIPSASSPSHASVEILRLQDVTRVHCISDLHVDSDDNMRWLESKCNVTAADDSRFCWDNGDLIVVAGDISHNMAKIEKSLNLLLQTGAHVVFVPGNHEAWLSPAQKEHDDGYSSLTKLEDIERLCRKLGVYTTGDCICAGGGETTSCNEELWILPLDSWYDGSLSFVDLKPNNYIGDSQPPNYGMVKDFGKWPWVDFVQCRWPSSLYPDNTTRLLRKIPSRAVEYFLNRNQPVIDAFRNATRTTSIDETTTTTTTITSKKTSVLTITHFLPNKQSLPDWKDPESSEFDFDSWLDHGAGGMSAKFALVGGSDKIDAQIRSLSLENTNNDFHKRIHVFGHSHRPKDFVCKGIRYIHNPLGKPREREMHMCNPKADAKLIWEAGNENIGKNETILRYWEEQGGGVEMLRKRMETNKQNRKLFFQKRKLRKEQQKQQEQKKK